MLAVCVSKILFAAERSRGASHVFGPPEQVVRTHIECLCERPHICKRGFAATTFKMSYSGNLQASLLGKIRSRFSRAFVNRSPN